MFSIHQVALKNRAPLGTVQMADTMHANIEENKEKIQKKDIIIK